MSCTNWLFLGGGRAAYLAQVGIDAELRLLARELPLECRPRLELLLLEKKADKPVREG
jgi:hypothetical protein